MSNWDKNVEVIRGNIIKLIVPKNINEIYGTGPVTEGPGFDSQLALNCSNIKRIFIYKINEILLI